ncbi:hypothetical protein [Streptomyces sp. MST-110588]|uniref:hypothetical protein n=1 Tax=Streptomyces sp. MST-110588 TaxID=2833628 RepID=UPI001F5E0753|nr:hypothetical protein [Streptomyces sp. MST-110588]UNO40866.1 hypothetical protein KGS77_16395 [Streptomyces sp. MST-110588]
MEKSCAITTTGRTDRLKSSELWLEIADDFPRFDVFRINIIGHKHAKSARAKIMFT